MAYEASFRSALNGFNKTDVMDYIEKLLLKASESAGVEASLRSKATEFEKKLIEAIDDVEKMRQDKNDIAAAYEKKLEAEKKARAEAENARRAAEAELEKVKIALFMKQEPVAVHPEEKLPDIVTAIPDACSDCDKAKLYEAQLGAAMLDAKRFSEILVKEANDKAADLLDNAGKCAVDTSKKAQLIAEDIKRLTNNFNNVYSQLYKQVNTLVENLDCFARETETNRAGYSYHTDFVPYGDKNGADKS